jgi:DHA2 family multidrug resistance protein
VLVPLWLQTNMGYTATWAGLTTALGGVLAVVLSPVVPRLMARIDARALVSFGVAGLGVIAFIRYHFASDADYWTIALTFLAQGAFMPFFFVPTTQIALSSVLPEEMASAAGLSNFLRTTAAAFCAALVLTFWDNAASRNHSDIAGALNDPAGAQTTLMHAGLTQAQALGQIDSMSQSQAVMLATDQMFLVMTIAFGIAACAVWLAPKPKIFGFGGPPGGGH